MPERDRRRTAEFLAAAGWRGADIQPLAGDASFRRYHRVYRNGSRAVLMDAPPDREDVRPFLRMARHLLDLGLSAPRVFAADETAGLVLLEDFGDDTFTSLLSAGYDDKSLYRLATDVLIHLHRLEPETALSAGVPPYDTERLLEEALLLCDWYMPAARGRPTEEGARLAYIAAWEEALIPALSSPATLVLRDFHVDNLMRLSGRDGLKACGLLDFQDAVAGPAAYDVMSLLEDARRDVSPALKAEMLARYAAGIGNADWDLFDRAFAVLAAQRHAKVIGIFTRLSRRDGKHSYLAHIPRVWRLLERALAHDALTPVAGWFDRHLPTPPRVAPLPPQPEMSISPRHDAPAKGSPWQAMVLAAGLGVRMRPMTDRVPKPLIKIGGRSLLDRAIDALEMHGVEEVVVNAHHLAPLIERHLAQRRSPPVRLCVEAELLETGGGIVNALPLFGSGPFFVVNGDVLWRDGSEPALARLAAAWDERRMDGLLLLHSVETALGYSGSGDFLLAEDGRLARRQPGGRAPFLFAGIQILQPRLFEGAPAGAFSLNVLYDRAIAAGRLCGVVHRGAWCHVGTPADIETAEAFLRRSENAG